MNDRIEEALRLHGSEGSAKGGAEREVGRRGGGRRAVAGNRRRSEDSRVVGCARRTGSDGGAEDLDRTDRTGRRSDG